MSKREPKTFEVSHTLGGGQNPWREAADELKTRYSALLDANTSAPNAPELRVSDAFMVGGVRISANRLQVGVDEVTANSILVMYEDGFLYPLDDAGNVVDSKYLPPIDLTEGGIDLPSNTVEPPNGTVMRIERGATPGNLINNVWTVGEVYLQSESISDNGGKRKSTKLIELVGDKVDQRSIMSIHFTMHGVRSPVQALNGVGGPNDVVASDRRDPAAGRVTAINGHFPAFDVGTSSPTTKDSDSWKGAGLLSKSQSAYTDYASGGGNGQIEIQPNNPTSGGITSSNQQPQQGSAPNLQVPLASPQEKHPVFNGKIPVPVIYDASLNKYALLHINASDRAPSTPRARVMAKANSGPIIDSEGHVMASERDPITGQQITEKAGAISTEAFFESPHPNIKDRMYFSAPKHHQFKDGLPNQPQGFVPRKVEHVIDPRLSHEFEDETFDRLWIWQHFGSFRPPEPEDPQPVSEGNFTPDEWERAEGYWDEKKGGHGLDTPSDINALSFTPLAMPALSPDATYSPTFAGAFKKLGRGQMPSAYDVDTLRAFDSLPEGAKNYTYYRQDSVGNPIYQDFDGQYDAQTLRKRASTASYSHPAEANPRDGIYPDEVTTHVRGFHPSMALQWGLPYPETDDLIRAGWRIRQEADDSDALAIDYIGTDGAVDASKVVKINGSEIGGGGGYWDRTGTTLSPTTSGDDVEVDGVMALGTASVSALKGLSLGINAASTDSYDGMRSALVSPSGASGDVNAAAFVTTLQGADTIINARGGVMNVDNDQTGGTISKIAGFELNLDSNNAGSTVTNMRGIDLTLENNGGATHGTAHGVRVDLQDNSTTAIGVGSRISSGTHTYASAIRAFLLSGVTINGMGHAGYFQDSEQLSSGRSAAIATNRDLAFVTNELSRAYARFRGDGTDTVVLEEYDGTAAHLDVVGMVKAQEGFQGKYVAVDTAGATHNGAWGEDVVVNNTTGSGTITINVPAVGADETNLNKSFTVQVRRTGVSVVVAMDGADTVFDGSNTAYAAGEWTVTSSNTGKISIQAGDERYAYACCVIGGTLAEPE